MATTNSHPSLDEVLEFARHLSPVDQARLVARLIPHLVEALDPASRKVPVEADPRERLAQIREAFRAQGPIAPSMAEDLAASRR